ncbi:MAG TPA: hypothetical protein VHD56_01130 [Tepidisphaeraceae bacterium]|nr:hypothetical protein [Tepidisphaeraceae bacterium]
MMIPRRLRPYTGETNQRLPTPLNAPRNLYGAFNWLLNILDLNYDGDYDPSDGDQSRDIYIYGHSWGGASAIFTAQAINSNVHFVNHTIAKLATIDPVFFGRFGPAYVPGNVVDFRNWYQSAGNRVTLLNIGPIHMFPVHGQPVQGGDPEDQQDMNNSNPNGIDHFSIINEVKTDLIHFLTGA